MWAWRLLPSLVLPHPLISSTTGPAWRLRASESREVGKERGCLPNEHFHGFGNVPKCQVIKTFKLLSSGREEEEEVATMDSLLMQEESWKGDQVLHYFPIFLAHGTAQTSLWCLKYSKALLREEEFPCSWAPCFFSRYPQCCCSIKWSLVSPERWVKSSLSTLKSQHLPLCPVEFYFSNSWCDMQEVVYKENQYRSSFGRE